MREFVYLVFYLCFKIHLELLANKEYGLLNDLFCQRILPLIQKYNSILIILILLLEFLQLLVHYFTCSRNMSADKMSYAVEMNFSFIF